MLFSLNSWPFWCSAAVLKRLRNVNVSVPSRPQWNPPNPHIPPQTGSKAHTKTAFPFSRFPAKQRSAEEAGLNSRTAAPVRWLITMKKDPAKTFGCGITFWNTSCEVLLIIKHLTNGQCLISQFIPALWRVQHDLMIQQVGSSFYSPPPISLFNPLCYCAGE